MLIPLLITIAAAIDLGQMNRYKTVLNIAADTAALAAVSPNIINDKLSVDKQKAESEAAAISMFNAEAMKTGATVTSATARYTPPSGITPGSVEVQYTARVKSIFGELAFNWNTVGGGAVANAPGPSAVHTNIYVLLDVSASMGLGVDEPTQTAMSNDADMQNCSFACHSSPINTAEVARKKGYVLRFDSVKEQLDQMLVDMGNKLGSSNSTLRLGIYAFDNGFRNVSPLGQNMALHRVALKKLDFSIIGGGTSLRHALVEMKKEIPQPGDGSSASKPKVVVIFITDALANTTDIKSTGEWDLSPTAYPPYSGKWCWDQNPPPTQGPWYPPVGAPKSAPCLPDPKTWNHAGSPSQELGPLDPAWCSDLKNYGVRLMTLYSRYDLPVPKTGAWEWQTKDWRYPFIYYYLAPGLPAAMQACASAPSDSFLAYDAKSIREGLGQLINNALPRQQTRLVR